MVKLALVPGMYYHIYNRSNNGENIFIEERNYRYFLQLYSRYIVPVAETYAYCLLRNHFHLAVRIKDIEEFDELGYKQEQGSSKEPCSLSPSKQFATFFGTYTKAINKVYQRTGTLFEGPFKRIPVENPKYLTHLVAYIHRNPQKHGFVHEYREWPFSSYGALIGQKPTKLERDTVLGWFDGQNKFQAFHGEGYRLDAISALVADDFF